MDKFGEKPMKKWQFEKNTWYGWLTNHTPKPIKNDGWF